MLANGLFFFSLALFVVLAWAALSSGPKKRFAHPQPETTPSWCVVGFPGFLMVASVVARYLGW